MLNRAKIVSTKEDYEGTSAKDFKNHIPTLQAARELANEITEAGAKLHDSLGKENELRVARTKAIEFLDSMSKNINSNTEHEYLEKCIRDLMGSQDEQINQMKDMISQLKQSESTLESKI